MHVNFIYRCAENLTIIFTIDNHWILVIGRKFNHDSYVYKKNKIKLVNL